jgi:hypothetical protein
LLPRTHMYSNYTSKVDGYTLVICPIQRVDTKYIFFIHFFRGGLNVLAPFLHAAWCVALAFTVGHPTYLGSISWDIDHWQPLETWHRLTPQAYMHSQVGLGQLNKVHANLETTCHTLHP